MIERLKIVPVDSIVSFEIPSENRVKKIGDEIGREGKLRNPLLVSPLDGEYLLLDSINMYRALVAFGAGHIPVQIADPDTISVRPWQRVLADFSRSDMLSFCDRFPRKMQLTDTYGNRLEPGQLEVRFKSEAPIRVAVRTDSALVRADICAMLYAEMSRDHRNFRAKIDYHMKDPFRGYPEASAILFPPMFSLDELSYLAAHEEYLPDGFIRSDQPQRVLGIDFPLSVLAEKVATEEKESFFRQMLKLRISLDRIAYYNGAVFMYNS